MSTATAHLGNLPHDLTSFVGRRAELADAKRQLASSRLVTLTGIGGVGKTRLAVRLCRELGRGLRDGPWMVDLVSQVDPGLVAEAIARAVGLRDDTGRWTIAALSDYLRDRQLLLLMDNCEHLLDAVAIVLESLLQSAPELRVVCTSRQALGVRGERVIVVPPLTAPDPGAASLTPEALLQFDSVALFVERASAAAAGFEVTPDNAATIGELMRRLDGIPLAVELAATRMRVLSPEQALRRLEDGYRFLGSAARAPTAHQRSLDALIEWSHDLCTPQERLLWARLSVFPDDFDLDAVEGICTGDGLAPADVLDALAGLVDKSVLVAVLSHDQVRYHFPQTIREFGRSRLTPEEHQTVLLRHSQYFCDAVFRISRGWFGPDQAQRTAWLAREHVNLLAAMELAAGDPDRSSRALGIAASLMFYWVDTGSLDEGRRSLERLYDRHPPASRGRCALAAMLAWLSLGQGDLEAVERYAAEARSLGQEFEDPRNFGFATTYLATARTRTQPDSARELFEQALTVAGSSDSTRVEILRGLAAVDCGQGDLDRARTRLTDAASICRQRGESWQLGGVLCSLAALAWQAGDASESGELARDSIGCAFPSTTASASPKRSRSPPGRKRTRTGQPAARSAGGLRRALGAALPTDMAAAHEATEDRLRNALGDRAFAAGWQAGVAMSFDETVAHVLGDAPPRPRPAQKPVLTRRETEIASLVAEGLSNREIAARMVISQRTAEGHVENILAKLGFTSRAQIAAWVAGHAAPHTD